MSTLYRDNEHADLSIGGNAKNPKISGYAAVWDKLSYPLHDHPGIVYREIIRKGAFTEAISGGSFRALVRHDDNRILASQKAGSLHLEEDTKGLKFEIMPAPTSYALDLVEQIRAGEPTGASFNIPTSPAPVERVFRESGELVRELLKVYPTEVSVSPYPAYPSTFGVSVRSIADYIEAEAAAQQARLDTRRKIFSMRMQELRSRTKYNVL